MPSGKREAGRVETPSSKPGRESAEPFEHLAEGQIAQVTRSEPIPKRLDLLFCEGTPALIEGRDPGYEHDAPCVRLQCQRELERIVDVEGTDDARRIGR